MDVVAVAFLHCKNAEAAKPVEEMVEQSSEQEVEDGKGGGDGA